MVCITFWPVNPNDVLTCLFLYFQQGDWWVSSKPFVVSFSVSLYFHQYPNCFYSKVVPLFFYKIIIVKLKYITWKWSQIILNLNMDTFCFKSVISTISEFWFARFFLKRHNLTCCPLINKILNLKDFFSRKRFSFSFSIKSRVTCIKLPILRN